MAELNTKDLTNPERTARIKLRIIPQQLGEVEAVVVRQFVASISRHHFVFPDAGRRRRRRPVGGRRGRRTNDGIVEELVVLLAAGYQLASEEGIPDHDASERRFVLVLAQHAQRGSRR